MRSLPTGKSQEVTSGDNSYYAQGTKFKFFKGELKVSHEPAESRWPSAQNNPHVKVAHPGDTCSAPLHSLTFSLTRGHGLLWNVNSKPKAA